jgi:hypothetical protein
MNEGLIRQLMSLGASDFNKVLFEVAKMRFEPKVDAHIGKLYFDCEPALCTYSRPSVDITIRVVVEANDLYHVNVFISTIDDASITFHGPSESLPKVSNRAQTILDIVDGWNCFCPSFDSLKKFSVENGLYMDVN